MLRSQRGLRRGRSIEGKRQDARLKNLKRGRRGGRSGRIKRMRGECKSNGKFEKRKGRNGRFGVQNWMLRCRKRKRKNSFDTVKVKPQKRRYRKEEKYVKQKRKARNPWWFNPG